VNIELIVGEIDAEIEKLKRIRAILEQLLTPKSPRIAKPRRARVLGLPQIELQPEPRLVVLPPKQRREYTRRVKQAAVEPKALAAPMTNRPVFVPKAAVRESQPAKTAQDGSGLEAVMRRKLLGGAA
jgi:hypothetical protein